MTIVLSKYRKITKRLKEATTGNEIASSVSITNREILPPEESSKVNDIEPQPTSILRKHAMIPLRNHKTTKMAFCMPNRNIEV